LALLNKRVVLPLILPFTLIILSVISVWQFPFLKQQSVNVKEVNALFAILPYAPYVFFSMGVILGWRFNNGGMILSAFILGFSYLVFSKIGLGYAVKEATGPGLPEALSFLLPLNLAFFATLTKRRLLTSMGLFCIILIGVQALALILLCQPATSPFPQLSIKIRNSIPFISKALTDLAIGLRPVLHSKSGFGLAHIPTLGVISFLLSFGFLFYRFFTIRDALSAGYLGAAFAAFLGMASDPSGNAPTIFFSASGLILISVAIETFFNMAYIDELTALPGRRSLNETLINLGKRYAIAMIDIDHFKKFNDKYGHRVGDQVLRMVATRLKAISGGAKVFRYGGEEFTAIFPGKSVQEAAAHLDTYRKIIETTPFTIRAKGRRRSSAENRGKGKTPGQKNVKVTVSIGVAAPNKRLSKPDKVLKVADKILYKAKKGGRNRVEY
jgi:diguanylate cyclase (GGDEF)-like protein